MALISCNNVKIAYDKGVVLKELTFNVNSGDYLCIIGENGSGKSTLIKAILGLKAVNGGEITFGENLKQSEIGYLPQQTHLQRDFPASVFEIVLSGCKAKYPFIPFYTKAQKDIAKMNMRRLEILDLKKNTYKELSGGQQQRVLLARALCATHRLLILDEPTGGLDPKVTNEFYKLISDINKSGITVITVSHDIKAAVQYATHILHLQGKPLFFGKTQDYLNSDACRAFIRGEKND